MGLCSVVVGLLWDCALDCLSVVMELLQGFNWLVCEEPVGLFWNSFGIVLDCVGIVLGSCWDCLGLFYVPSISM